MSEVRWRDGDTLPAPEATTDLSRKPSTDLRARLDNLPPGHPSAADYPQSSWERAKTAFAEAWQRHQDRWPRPDHKPGRNELTTPVEREFADGCDKIQAAADEITDKLCAIEAQQPGRALAGLEFCLKGRDRVIEKASEYMREMPTFSPTQALAMVPDPVRYTFTYEEHDYCDLLQSDIGRLKSSGFEMIKLKNYWTDPEYKGINTQWRDTGTGQRFEVQFHTSISFECKQVTHDAYERIRNPADVTSRRELGALHKLQRDIASKIPMPQGATYIRDQA
jgi:hypothetical protein